MTAAPDRSFVSSVVFLEFVDYTRKPVAEQIAIKERFNALLAEALAGVPAAERIILDASDGVAISFVGDPEDALHVAMQLRDATAAEAASPKIETRMGINTGAVKLVKDAHGQPNVVGDGIDVAQRVMSFADPGTLLASRAFYELVSVLSQDYAQLFHFEGSRTDHQIREHQVYSIGAAAHDLRDTVPVAGSPDASKKKLWMLASLAAVVILALAIGVRMNRNKPVPAPEPALAAAAPIAAPAPPEAAATEPSTAAKAAKPKATKAKAAPSPVVPASAPASPVPAPAAAPAAAPGAVNFAVTPWGEVYIDGAKRGVSPPLREVQITPGKHTIEVRNTSFPSYSTTVEVTSGGQTYIRYKFQ